MSIESGRYVRIEDNGQENDSGGVGRTRIQDKIRQPSCFLAHGEQVSGWAFFPYYAPIFAHRCISILHRCITKSDNAPILYPRLQNAPTDAPTAIVSKLPCRAIEILQIPAGFRFVLAFFAGFDHAILQIEDLIC